MRALANDREITATLGVPVRRVEAVAWLGSGLISGFAGLLLSNLVGLDAATLTFLVISTLAAALIARLRSLVVTLVAGLVVGLVTALVDADPVDLAVPRHGAVRPRDDRAAVPLGHEVGDRGAGERVSTARAASLSTIDRATWVRIAVVAGLLAVLVFVLPAVLSLYWIDVLTAIAIYSVVALGLALLMGRVGLVSLGQIAILALGAWVAARIDFATSLPFPIVLLLAGLITMVLGTLVGLPALRLSGLYLALITLMLAGAITVVLTATNFPNGGPVPRPHRVGDRQHRDPPARRSPRATRPTSATRSSSCALMFLLALLARPRASRAAPGPRSARASRRRSPRA